MGETILVALVKNNCRKTMMTTAALRVNHW
jgi:hypothetical protein